MTTKELVRLYAQGGGSDDVASAEFLRRGTKARDELIVMLDDPKTAKEDSQAIVMILFVHFRSDASIRALERYATRTKGPFILKLIEEMKKPGRSGARR